MNSDSFFIRPLQLRDFLKLSGWRVIGDASAGQYIFRNNEVRREIRFPVDESSDEYEDSLEFAYQKLQEIYKKSRRDLFQDILLIQSDVINLRLGTYDNRPSISIDTAERSISALERLLRSASSTVRRPQTNFKRMSFSESSSLLQSAKLEQTAIGSYVMRVSCPIRALEDESPSQLELGNDPFVRRVFDNLFKASSRAVAAVISDTVGMLTDSVLSSDKPFISANFCEALSQLAELSDKPSDLRFLWSPIIYHDTTRPVRLSSEFADGLMKMASLLKDEEVVESETFVGTVERLDGVMGKNNRRSGEVILSLLQSDEVSTIRARVYLTAEQYEIADSAHMTPNSFVRVTGRLHPGRQPRSLDVLTFDKVV